jgi:hypothetical protein
LQGLGEGDQIMAKFKRMFASTQFVCALLVGPSFAADGPLYKHNGSLVRFLWLEGNYFEIQYEKPRKGLKVKPGDVVISGDWPREEEMSGKAHLYSTKCGNIEFEVYSIGTKIEGSEKGPLKFRGEQYIRDKNCKITGKKSVELSFTYVRD